MKRASGILLPVFSLPSNYGIGTIGKEAMRFIDFLSESDMSYWQILPLGPTGYGDSPYQSFSTFAGNPYFIDLDNLIEEGYLLQSEVDDVDWYDTKEYVNYGKIYNGRNYVLDLAFKRACEKGDYIDSPLYKKFIQDNVWIDDYSLYMSVKEHFNMSCYIDWQDEDIKLKKSEAVEKYSNLLRNRVEYYKFIQFLFYKQWNVLREYARVKNVKLIGDIPIYVSLDSADCWGNSSMFMLDEKNVPTFISGVPPDYFSENGQLWGNPLYDWDAHKCDNYSWWKNRIEGAAKLYDVIRIDHFRGIESFWSVKYGMETAKEGQWIKGPGKDFVDMIHNYFPDTVFIAEDLGVQTDELKELLSYSKMPGMKILEFAFTPGNINLFMPYLHEENTICYTGTHDNIPLGGWKDDVGSDEVEFFKSYTGISNDEDIVKSMIRLGFASKSNLFIAQLQDYLMLGKESRINYPGNCGGNWQWRIGDIDYTKLKSELLWLNKTFMRGYRE